ncbi:transporter family-2 protein [Paenibacillus algorifonticola]|uniref:Transporter family-2 protein n=1 Tax=Paenibacillus algorifonticola TaxID=684063 RepID=A0A1I2ADJ0_9BACL|nr:DMT family transporter [Paenibacillus algorifonticola]SFE41966.1 transporter family-2 protein [Paenibacillus algorifonticola]
MKGILFAILGGACITLQGIANTRISGSIGTWQAATLTQFTGFIVALIILMCVGAGKWREFQQVKPLYLAGGSFAAIIIFSNVTAIQQIGVTLMVSMLLIAQLGMTVIMETNGFFGLKKQKISGAQLIGIGMMISGVFLLKG